MMTNPYEKLECIGKGSFGEVYKGRDVHSGQIVALKLVDLEKADEEIDVIQREIKVMSQISNPFVVKYYSSLMKGSTLWIVMEFMSGGSLKELVDAVGPLPEDAIATIMKALCKGLDYVHKGHKLHRDIKAANILLSDQGDVKLADFGVAGQMTSTVRQRNTFVGSPFWMAPEVIQESLYDEKADLWSVGITAIELANGLPPYATEHPYRALFLIPKNDPPRLEGQQFSRSFKEFVSLCLRKNPAERPSAEQLLGHAFVKKARSSSVRDLLRQKEATSKGAESTHGTVVIGGDTFNGSRHTVSPNGSLGSGNAQSLDTMSKWEFDFGSFNEDDAPSKDTPTAATTSPTADAPTASAVTATTADVETDAKTTNVASPSSSPQPEQPQPRQSPQPESLPEQPQLPQKPTQQQSKENSQSPQQLTLPLPNTAEQIQTHSKSSWVQNNVNGLDTPPPVTTAASAPELGSKRPSGDAAEIDGHHGRGNASGATSGAGMRTSRSEEDASAGGLARVDATTTEVLTDVILPVVSQIRGEVDAAGGDGTSLIQSLGKLEVAFLDVETTKPGFSATLLRALLQEALRSRSPGVRSLLASCLYGSPLDGPG